MQEHMKRLVFLHVPKTAGQTVHFELARVFGADQVSPIRVHTQAKSSCFSDWQRYQLFSGHIDWHDLDRVPQPQVVFSILRAPRERIASFYFYLRAKAEATPEESLRRPENRGLLLAQSLSTDDYFCAEDLSERAFLDDHYDNFYTYYFATKKVRGRSALDRPTSRDALLDRAVANAKNLDLVCMTDRLDLVEELVAKNFEFQINLQGRYANRGPLERSLSRYDALRERLVHPRSVERVERFCEMDDAFIAGLGLTQN
jgi:hypothetical protein